jgi:endonuclease/exonuclease/phosphatase family metal-dependent hydrolase
MKILTWNILAEEWIEKEYYPTIQDFSVMDSSRRITLILNKLYRENADIMLLQEVMDVDYDLLFKHFKKEYYISSLHPIRWDKLNSSSGNITMVRKTLVKRVSEFPLDYGIGVKADHMVIYNVHLDDVSLSKRKKQISLLRPMIEKEKYVILGGDFNQEYTDSCPIYQFEDTVVHNKCVTYFVEKNMNIDNIITKGFMTTMHSCPFVPTNVTEGVKVYGSDHIPVIIEVY